MKRKIDGVLLLDKPYGWSSTKALGKVRWLLQAQKAGHTGVLDPLATGLLPICLGEATKFAQRWLDADKGYLATIQLGQTMTTGDLEGEVVETRPVTCSERDVLTVLQQFHGEISQVPPIYSALKHQGKPLYEYARAGVEIERQARTITIYELQLVSCQLPTLEVSVRCSKGTYIRTLAEDIGKALGCGAHLTALRRTGTGGFDLSSAYTLEAVEALEMGAREALLLPVDLLLGDLPQLILPMAESIKLSHGQTVRHNGQPGQQRVYNPEGKFIGLGELREGVVYPARMMGNA